MGSADISAEAILERYERPHWHEPLANLTDQETAVVAAYFEANDIVLRSSFRGNYSGPPLTVYTMISGSLDVPLHSMPDAFVGPYIEDGKSKPNSVGLWGTRIVPNETAVA